MQELNQKQITSAIKDMNGTIQRINKNPDFVKRFPKNQLVSVMERLQAYKPKTDKVKKDSAYAMKCLSRWAAGNDPRPNEQAFDTLRAGQNVAQTSCVFELRVKSPSFWKAKDAKELLKKLGNKAKINPEQLYGKISLVAGDGRKRLNNVRQSAHDFRDYLKGISVNSGGLALNGQYLIPLSRVDEVKNRLDKMMKIREDILDQFIKDYDALKGEARKANTDFYSEADYPATNDLKEKHEVYYKFISNQVPEELKKISKAIYEAESIRITQECAAASMTIRQALRGELHKMVSEFANKLGHDEKTGKPKVFKGKRVEKMKTFMATFKDRDLTDDKELRAIVDQANKVLSNMDIKKVRNDEEFRSSISEEFTKITDSADDLIVIETRKVELD